MKSKSATAIQCGSLIFSIFIFVLSGCDIPKRPPLTPPKKSTVKQDIEAAKTKSIEYPTLPFKEDWESWYAYYLGSHQVGYSYISAKKSESLVSRATSKPASIQYYQEDQVLFRRGKSSFVQHLIQDSTESNLGKLLNFNSRLIMGPVVTEYTGELRESEKRFAVTTKRGTSQKTDIVQWNGRCRGLVSVEQSMRRQPMTPGEKRTLEALLPIHYKIASIHLNCVGKASVAMLDGSYKTLFEVVSLESLGKEVSEQVIWCDEQGVIQKMLRPAVGLVAYRASKESAKAGAVLEEQVIAATSISVDGKIDQPSLAKQAGFVIAPNQEIKKSGAKISIPTAPGQFVRKVQDGTFQVFVSRVSDQTPKGFTRFDLKPSPKDVAHGLIINGNSGEIARAVRTSIRGEFGEKAKAIELAQAAKRLISVEHTSKGLAPASVIAQNVAGQSTEFAIVLAALLRHEKIPARIAIGLACQEDEPSKMFYQMWTLAFVEGRWIALDGMQGGEASAARIALVTTSFSDRNEYNEVAQVLAAMGQMDIKIQAATY